MRCHRVFPALTISRRPRQQLAGIGVWLLALVALPSPASETLTLKYGDQQRQWTLDALQQQLKVQQISLPDPSYQQQKHYRGFLLRDVWQQSGLPQPAPDDELLLTASDGYTPTVPARFILQSKAVLAFAEQGMADFQFSPLTQGKTTLSPAPFYLVWPDAGAEAEQYPWPYQLVRIELIRFADRYSKTLPAADAADAAKRGFGHFKQHCLKCHSINLQGGELGPELNAPKNVTEYWRAADLRAFITEPQSYRYKSKMPPFGSQLSPAQIDEVLAYLQQMSRQKISSGG